MWRELRGKETTDGVLDASREAAHAPRKYSTNKAGNQYGGFL